MTTITARSIAESIIRPHEKAATVIDRIRHWTDAGMLSVVGKANPGTGKHRAYEPRAFFEAAVLDVVSKTVGRPVTSTDFAQLFRVTKDARDWTANSKAKRFIAFAFSERFGGKLSSGKMSDLVAAITDPEQEAHVVINLTALIERTQKWMGEHGFDS